ncbi:serine/threonine-protein kinase [Streptomyces sp. RFCAC02]|uniref:serine/threonine-protein kinase n=1 Tax=Streptomyces sp. RFCAC02 TaxID=2499143 RepID=UPI001020399B|nr:serine/threonine-protein kinase [Streptomyces sp. RFCAC02]
MKPLGPKDPQRVGQYRLLGKLGAGGMGSVYLARSDRGRTVAVKLVQPELAAQPEFRQRFQHEVEAARRVGGEWTAPVLGCDTEAETPWVATGYVAGPSLHEVVSTTYGPLPERTLLILANGLVRALRDIHAAGLVHRDLKPSNVMITIDGPRVIDFGIARALEANGEGLTRTGAAVGSPGFMSPEQCRGETLTAASDVFCLGSVLTFAATGRTPFGDANSAMTALMLRIVQGQQDLDGVPDGVRPLIENCLAQNPADRPSLDQLLQFTDIADDGDEPWLPGALVARLGRHAVELLDSEDPLQAPPLPQNAPPPAMPGQPPVTPLPTNAPPAQPPAAPPTPTAFSAPPATPATPPPGGTGVDAMATMTSATPPPGYGTPPPAGYGYPQQPGPGYGYPQPGGTAPASPYGPGYPGGPGLPGTPLPGGPGGGSNKNRNILIAAIAAVVAIAVIVGAVVLTSGGGDDPDDDPTAAPTQDVTESPSPDDGEPTTDPTTDPADDGTMPNGYVGAWEAYSDGGFWVRVELSEGATGATVATVYSVLSDRLCIEGGNLESGSADGVSLVSSGPASTIPSDLACAPYATEQLTLQGDGSMSWSATDDSGNSYSGTLYTATTQTGDDGMPYDIFSQTYQSDTLSVTFTTTGYAGESAVSYTDGSCTWDAVLVSGDEPGTAIIVGPGVASDSACENLPPYTISWDDPASGYAPSIEFTPHDSAAETFTATLVE